MTSQRHNGPFGLYDEDRALCMPLDKPISAPTATSTSDHTIGLEQRESRVNDDHVERADVIVVHFEAFIDWARDRIGSIDEQELRRTLMEAGDTASGHIQDARSLTELMKLLRDFGFNGRMYVRHYQGKPYVIFKGYAGLRQVFTGTRYGAGHVKLLSYGIGEVGTRRAARVGTVWTLVFVLAWEVAEYVLDDQATLASLGANVTTDVSKALISGLAGYAAAVGIAATATAGSVVVLPIAAGLLVGLAVGFALDELDEHFRITDALQSFLENTHKEMEESWWEFQWELNRWIRWINSGAWATP